MLVNGVHAKASEDEYPRAIYYVINHGDRREPIFGDTDCGFLEALAEVVRKK